MFIAIPSNVLTEVITLLYPPSNVPLVVRKRIVNSKEISKGNVLFGGDRICSAINLCVPNTCRRSFVRRVFVHNRISSPVFVFVRRVCAPPGAADVLFPVRSKHRSIHPTVWSRRTNDVGANTGRSIHRVLVHRVCQSPSGETTAAPKPSQTNADRNAAGRKWGGALKRGKYGRVTAEDDAGVHAIVMDTVRISSRHLLYL